MAKKKKAASGSDKATIAPRKKTPPLYHLKVTYKGNTYRFFGCEAGVWRESAGRGLIWLDEVSKRYVLHFFHQRVDVGPARGGRCETAGIGGTYEVSQGCGGGGTAFVEVVDETKLPLTNSVLVTWNGYTRTFYDYGGGLWLEQYSRGEIWKFGDTYYMSLYSWPGSHEDQKTGGPVTGTYDYGAVAS